MSYNSIYNLIGIKSEVERLKTQAKLGWNKEFRTLKWLGLRDGMKILDVGSGPGFYTELLLENLPKIHITALEVDNNLMSIAKERLYKFNDSRVNFKLGSINNSGLEPNSYDFIICRFVFQHLENPILAAKEIYKLLKPGGIVAIIDSDRGLWGISDPDNIINNGRSVMNQIEKKARWNREVGRKLIKILKTVGFLDLDFEAVTIHSDLVGIKNIIGDFPIGAEQLRILNRKNPRLASIIKKCGEITKSENYTIILLNLIAKGVKPRISSSAAIND